MKIASLIVLICFTLMGIFLLYSGYKLRDKGFKPLGKPTIQPVFFYIGKFAIFTSWGFLLVNAILVLAEQPSERIPFPLPAALLMGIGTMIMILALKDLGDSLRVGLPEESTALKTRGIYKISRNPIYLGVDLIAIASILFFPGIINIICAIAGIGIHHFIILSEERFLEDRFREDWSNYKKESRRYI